MSHSTYNFAINGDCDNVAVLLQEQLRRSVLAVAGMQGLSAAGDKECYCYATRVLLFPAAAAYPSSMLLLATSWENSIPRL